MAMSAIVVEAQPCRVRPRLKHGLRVSQAKTSLKDASQTLKFLDHFVKLSELCFARPELL
jgi:hypothetical protein